MRGYVQCPFHGHALLVSDPSLRNILCVGVDALPEGAPWEIFYNLISDAGCAVILSRESLQCRRRSFHQVSKGYYWNIVEKQKEIIASYFPSSRAVINFRKSASRTVSSRPFSIARIAMPATQPLSIRSARMEGPTTFCFSFVFTALKLRKSLAWTVTVRLGCAFQRAPGSIVRWSAKGDTTSAPLGGAPDLSACRMASPMNFCTVFFIGRAPSAL
jgi:hypothetical protein